MTIKGNKKKSKKTRQDYVDEQFLKNYLTFEAVWLTKAFRKFCQENPDKVKTDETLQSAFLNTSEGKLVQAGLNVFAFLEMAIWYERKVFAEKYLNMRIDLTFSKERIRAEFEHILNEMHPRVKRPPIPPRGGNAITKEKIDQMLRAYELVENYLAHGESVHQSIVKTTLQLYTIARSPRLDDPPQGDRRYQQVRRWYLTVKDIIRDL